MQRPDKARLPDLIRLFLISVAYAVAGVADLPACQSAPSVVVPAAAGVDANVLRAIDAIVAEGLERKAMPGCVVVVGRRDGIVWFRAYGYRQVAPALEKMTLDTVFDLASLTKPIATATSIMKLADEGKLNLDDKVAVHLPEFGANEKSKVTIKQLLLHTSGLTPDNPLADYQDGPKLAMERIHGLKLEIEPGAKFTYSDVGYIVLGEVVQRVAGENFDVYTRSELFQPLGMNETGFLPSAEFKRRAAPTDQQSELSPRGEVHDPRASRLGGVAGHAGLFSTAEDLARFATLLLGKGEFGGVRVLSRESVEIMTRPHEVLGGIRALGWDMSTSYSSNRGDLFSHQAFGHGGFTGTSIWIDPGLDLYVIFLSNRLHPDGKGIVNPLIGRIGTVAAAAIRDVPDRFNLDAQTQSQASVLTGIDVLRRDSFVQLQGRHVGLITNQTGVARDGRTTAQLLNEADGVHMVSLFSPEHGLSGKIEDAIVRDTVDSETGLPVYSLYNDSREPTADSLRGIDTLVFDIQEVGTRFYTYISTLGLAMRTAAQHKIRIVVLDRPNPISGAVVQGPVLDVGAESFVGFHRIPVRHGMTVGELARMFNQELSLELDLQIIELEGWDRRDFYDATGLLWVNPSPNIRQLNQALLYPGIGLLETTNISVGRGTDQPFEQIGAPWIDNAKLAEALNQSDLVGVRFVPVRFTPSTSKFSGERCNGISILITERDHFDPLRTGLTIACELHRLFPQDWDSSPLNTLLGSQQCFSALQSGASPLEIERQYQAELEEFLARRRPFLIYE